MVVVVATPGDIDAAEMTEWLHDSGIPIMRIWVSGGMSVDFMCPGKQPLEGLKVEDFASGKKLYTMGAGCVLAFEEQEE